MPYFDYSLPDVPDFSDALGKIVERRKKRQQADAQMAQQRQQHEQDLVFQREQENRKFEQAKMNDKYQRDILAQRAKREGLEFNQRQNTYRGSQSDRIRKAIAENNPQLAQQIADETRLYDSDTGHETARGKLTAGPLPEMPDSRAVMPPDLDLPDQDALAKVSQLGGAQPAGTAVAKRKPVGAMHGIPQLGILGRVADMASQEAGSQQQEHDIATRRFDSETQGYAERARNAERDRPYSLQFGNEPPQTIDMRTQRSAGREAAADDFMRTVAQLPLSPQDKEEANLAVGAIRSGGDPQKILKQFYEGHTLGRKQTFAGEQGDLRDQNRLDVQQLKNEAPRPSFNLNSAKFGFEQEKFRSQMLRTDMEKFLARNAAKEIGEADRDSIQLEKNLASGEPGTIRAGLLKLWQIAQKDTRMSDKDAVLANSLDQSVLSTLEGWVTKGAEGVPGDMNLQAAMDTARRLRGYYVEKNKKLQGLYREQFYNTGQYDPKEVDVLGAQTFPGWGRLTDNQPAPKGRGTGRRGGPPEVNARTKGKAAAASKDDEAMQ